MFIVLEGLNGSGKTTQCKILKEKLIEKYGEDNVICTGNPGSESDFMELDEFGSEIRAIASKFDKEDWLGTTMLMTLAIRENYNKIIKPALAQGKHVICDRYVYSTAAYQGCGFGASPEDILAFQNYIFRLNGFKGIPYPTHIFLLDCPIEDCQSRAKHKHIFGSVDNFTETDTFIMKNYRELMKESTGDYQVIRRVLGNKYQDNSIDRTAEDIAYILTPDEYS